MKLGHAVGCHQKASRSFFINNYQLPVCARCSGVLLGQAMAVLAMIFFRYIGSITWGIVFLAVMFIDWLTQATKLKKSTNSRRLITGLLGGIGYITVLTNLILVVLR
ncbi:DUF2085 domain-containing protein [Proteinivorax hydrogeniformans]|uniref:DUF2085 domain-containing protein n=1 Tax=Proteinivorax hydrogeniformans TaxID=1826727 RepID=A0AAU8HQW6_9FIRM